MEFLSSPELASQATALGQVLLMDLVLAGDNAVAVGLAAAVWTRDLNRAHRMARKLRAGSVWVNYWDGGDMTAPFGGYKQSGVGREWGLEGIEDFTEIKAIGARIS